MAKQVILAVAGAGKTYRICNTIDPCKKNLILAYTHENIHNIKAELLTAYGCVPELTNVMTFDSFVYRYMVRPYEPSIAEYFECPDFRSTGITMINPPPQRIKTQTKWIPNPAYPAKDKLRHYVTDSGHYYCKNLSELVMQIKKGRNALVKRASEKVNYFYDAVLIDEFQDFREHNYELIVAMAKRLENVILVGDYYQHSVLGKNNSGKPFKKKQGDIGYDEFIAELRRLGFSVDPTSLDKSRRCSVDICKYVTKKLGINIKSNGDHTGKVIWIEEDRAAQILEDSRW